ncbi:hypothetical protein C8255_08420 [filamentous cyanobacterium CCP3]|nr:hypothetical protein C8255_08420 [filamentous cyanobacterium CCP3]
MSLRSQLALATLSILATAALAATAADARPGQGRGPRPQPSQPVVQEVVPQVETPLTVDTEATAGSPEVTVETSETVDQGSLPLHGTAAQNPADNYQNLPPGLQRRVNSGRDLPPGLQQQIDSGRDLPAGLNR